jgi:PAS domain S-box-containing protein
VIILAVLVAASSNPHALFPLIAFAVNSCLAIFVYAKDKKRGLNKVFALWNITAALYSLALYGLYLAPSPEAAKNWSKIFGVGFYFLPATLLHFILVFIGDRSRRNNTILKLSYLISTVFFVLSFVKPFENEYVKTGVKYSPKGTPLYVASMAFIVAIVLYGLIEVLRKYRRTFSRERNQYKFFFLGGIGHRFLDIEVIVKKSAVYASLTLVVVGGYAGVMIVANTIFNIASPAASVPLNAVVIVLIAFLFQPLRAQIQSFVDRRFFREKYNYRETLRRFSNEIVKTVGLEELSLRLVNAVTETMKVKSTCLILRNQELEVYEIVAEKQFGQNGIYHTTESRDSIDSEELFAYFAKHRQLLDREEIKFSLGSSMPDGTVSQLIRLLETLDSMDAEIVIPIYQKNELRGIFLVGPKLSEEGYFAQDVELLQIIVNQTAIAIENSELYDKTLSIKRYYDDIIKSMTSGMLTVDRAGSIVTLNEAGEEILGIRVEDVMRRNASEVFKDNQEFGRIVLDTLDSSRPSQPGYPEVELAYRNQNERTLAVTTSFLRNQKNEIVGVVALFSDITEKKELEKQIERSKRLAYMGEMAANIAHEIKNPIGSIRLFVDTLSRDFTNPVAQKNFMEVIPQEVENIDRMVKDLLFLARPARLNKVNLDLAEIVGLSVKLCNEGASAKTVSLEFDVPGCPANVLADGEKIKQALCNIILNAIDAVTSGEGRIVISLETSDNETRIIVRDNGPGISEELASRLFYPFFTTKHEGTGLGLAIANKIVQDHGGAIEVDSKEGVGTTFSIKLPPADDHQ